MLLNAIAINSKVSAPVVCQAPLLVVLTSRAMLSGGARQS